MHTVHYILNDDLLGSEIFFLIFGCITAVKQDLVVLLMSLELVILTLSLEFLEVAEFLDDVTGEILVLFILTVSACESAIALALLVAYFRVNATVEETDLIFLKG